METPVGAPIKEKLRIEIAKLREMTFKEKLEYIWEYYKIHIIVVCVLLFLIGGMLNTRFFNPPPDTALFISWNSGYATMEQFDLLQDVLEELVLEGERHEEIMISHVIINDADPAMSIASMQRLVAMIAAGEIDILILDSELLKQFTTSGFLRPMESLLAEVEVANPMVYSAIKEKITIVPYEHEDGNLIEHAMGVSIGSSPRLSQLGFFEQELYFSISVSSGRTENVIKTLIALFE